MRNLFWSLLLFSQTAFALDFDSKMGLFTSNELEVSVISTSVSWESDSWKPSLFHQRTLIKKESTSSGRDFGLGLTKIWNTKQETSVGTSVSLYPSEEYRAYSGSLTHTTWVTEQFQLLGSSTVTKVSRKEKSVLRDDLANILVPAKVSVNSASLGARFILTSSTIVDGNYTLRDETTRPNTHLGQLGVRQAFKELGLGVHVEGGLGKSKGDTEKSDKGEMENHFAKVTFIKELWEDSLVIGSYRFYKEKEILTTDTFEYGSDLISLQLTQKLNFLKKTLNLGAGIAKYMNNQDVTGNFYSMNLGISF